MFFNLGRRPHHSQPNHAPQSIKLRFPSGRLMSEPMVWGKLPTQADFIMHGVKSGHTQLWTQWLNTHAVPSKTSQTSQTSQAVAFILQAGQLGVSKQCCVLGILFHSVDKAGRKHPLIVYSVADTRWVARYWHKPQHPAKDWQFWLSQLLDSAFTSSLALSRMGLHSEGLNAANNAIQAGLSSSIRSLWQLHAPRWQQRFDAPPKHPDAHQCAAVIRSFEQGLAAFLPPKPHQNFGNSSVETESKQGVQHFPWSDWPERLRHGSAVDLFWQQNAQGAYTNAAEQLAQLKLAAFY